MSSRKSKREKRKEKQKKRDRESNTLPAFPRTAENELLINAPPGMEKMSDGIMEFLAPYDKFWKTEEQLRKLFPIAMIA